MTAMQEIFDLMVEYEFPLEVLTDVNHRIETNVEEGYLLQQKRYLERLIKSGIVSRKREVLINVVSDAET